MIWPRVVQIGCPQCQTHYALDDRLVPAGGAPVQCTRCGHVFIAYRPGEGPAPGAPSKADAPSPPPTGGTQVFGGTAPSRAPAAGVAPAPSTNSPAAPS